MEMNQAEGVLKIALSDLEKFFQTKLNLKMSSYNDVVFGVVDASYKDQIVKIKYATDDTGKVSDWINKAESWTDRQNRIAAEGGLSGQTPSVPFSEVTFPVVKDTYLYVAWQKAESAFIDDSLLQYKVVYSTTANLTDAASCETNGTVARDWTPDIDILAVSGLPLETLLWFNVLVRDPMGNVSVYAQASAVTLSDITGPVIANPITLVTSLQQTSLDLGWEKATDLITPPETLVYTVYSSLAMDILTPADCEANGTVVGSGTDISGVTIIDLLPGTTYFFTVVVEDTSGNKTAYFVKEVTMLP
jgi:hypothetical protein